MSGFVTKDGEEITWDENDPGSLEAWYRRFWSYVAIWDDTKCWEWQRARDTYGYGVMRLPRQRRLIRAHRAAYLYEYGGIPSGLFVCHRCNNKSCVNPAHLYVATHKQNIQDASADGLMVRPFCKYGHPFTNENTVGRVRHRCRICTRKTNARSRARRINA